MRFMIKLSISQRIKLGLYLGLWRCVFSDCVPVRRPDTVCLRGKPLPGIEANQRTVRVSADNVFGLVGVGASAEHAELQTSSTVREYELRQVKRTLEEIHERPCDQ